MAKSKDLFEKVVQDAGQAVQDARALAACFLLATGAGVQAFGVVSCFRGVFPAFCLLSCFALGALLANVALFSVLRGFSAGFSCWVWVCIACVLCVACGAFVCVRG